MAGIEEDKKSVSDSDGKMKPPKEHGSMGYVLSQIPKKAQKGLLVQCELIMTCLDANQEYIVIGTNIGILFLYDRKRTVMERLRTGGQCRSTELLIEVDSDIVQLHHAHRCLPGPFGGVFIPGLCKTEDAELYAVRPGMRIWQACVDGTVKATYLFKELINKPHPEILLLYNDVSSSKTGDVQFGRLLLYMDKYLVTWNTSALFILSPSDNEVIGSQSNIGTIEDVAVTKDEIFVLRKNADRALIRIAENPENTGNL
ncbi:hypothetical protein KUTeg_013802 [Tegillarca granosa]|uniref:CNH domain-containing protein n=1 Tax=Tegillarca granosa TaxID=220873 RepID=A0ABQ9EUQ1_TEGGR|nr:hypothetical protein KUTeg_013802 [Tegillarca granosa]